LIFEIMSLGISLPILLRVKVWGPDVSEPRLLETLSDTISCVISELLMGKVDQQNPVEFITLV